MADLEKLAAILNATGPVKVEPTPRRVRALFNGTYLFDTTSALHVWEHKYFPQFWVPRSAFSVSVLKILEPYDPDGVAFRASITVKDKTSDRVIVSENGPLKGYVRVEFKAADAWFEEDQQIYDHPKNPYTRIDILLSSRKIIVKIGGTVIAESSNPSFLFETGLRTRFYLPKTSVKWEYLSKSDTTSKCPYKGLAQYYNVTIEGKEFKDVIWWYEYPTHESAAIQGLVCFYNEKVETYIDGVLEEK